MKNSTVILCPIPRMMKGTSSRHFFGSHLFEEIASQSFGKKMEVKYLYFGFSSRFVPPFLSVLILTFKVLFTKHDVLYFTVDPIKHLYLLSILKAIRLYVKPMYAWSYFIHNPTGWKQKVLKIFYAAFDRFFLISESHVDVAVQSGILQKEKAMHLDWGVDLASLDALKKNTQKDTENRLPVFVIAGKAQRDFKTLLKAFEGIDNAVLKIYTSRIWNGLNHEEDLRQNSNPNVRIRFEDELDISGYPSTLEFVLAEMLAADCAVICCNAVNYGVGFTQLLDSLSCSLPVLLTDNPDMPIDVEAENVGYKIPPYDVTTLRARITDIINRPENAKRMGANGRKLIEKKYSIQHTAKEVLSIILYENSAHQ